MDNIFEKATRKNLRFGTSKGALTTEDLWDLSLDNLDTLAKALDKQVVESDNKSFIKKQNTTNEEAKLKFDVVLHIINVKLAEAEAAKTAADKKAKKQQILELISEKENEVMKGKSLDELKALLED